VGLRWKRWIRAVLYLMLTAAVFGIVTASDDRFYTRVKKLDRIALIIKERYAEETDLNVLIEAGIEGMLYSLDPYCRYFTDDDFRDFMDNTYGEFEGIGIEVDFQQNRPSIGPAAVGLTIISVLEGTPAYRAGLKPGDRIVSIDGKPTSEMTREQAAQTMRGSSGTEIELTIRRISVPELMHYRLIRETIETKSIPYFDILSDSIAYIRLTRFTETAHLEMVEALSRLLESRPKGIILDIRSNPGGLLMEAVKVAGLFLEPNKLIVETRSRDNNVIRHYSSNEGLVCTDLPLVVLVDEGTASAAEIVAGAIQDWQRGLIIGSPTYGKGLVQRIIRLDDVSALKITTAKYYIPSGRCIQKPSNAGGLDVEKAPSETDSADAGSAALDMPANGKNREEGGIEPDIRVEPIIDTEVIKALKRQSLFFNFAFKYVSEHPLEVDSSFIADDRIFGRFKNYLDEDMFDYQPLFESRYDSLVAYLPDHSIPPSTKILIEELGDNLRKLKFQRLDADRELIKWVLTEEILVLKYGPASRYGVAWVNHHPEILEARRILNSRN
jgi:carboxyl-terminal processing protease